MEAKLIFDDACGHYCPSCNHPFNVSTRALQNIPEPKAGDLGICIYCGALFKNVQDGLLLKLVVINESQLTAKERQALAIAREKQAEIKQVVDRLNRLFRKKNFN